MKVVGLDLGTKTLGIAISDETKTIASGLTTIRFDESDYEMAINKLRQVVGGLDIEAFVIGLPKNMNNTDGFAVKRTRDFEKLLDDAFKVPVYEQDERLSSVAANNVLISANVSRKKRKGKVDTVAAIIILQNYLDIRKGIDNGKQ